MNIGIGKIIEQENVKSQGQQYPTIPRSPMSLELEGSLIMMKWS